jgi:glycosyltransferase involved in cell wall biosynthesis
MAESPAQTSVSAIIPAYNAQMYLRDAIDSVLSQTCPVLECVVVDDGSSDATADLAEDYGHPVRVVRQANAGVSVARNLGAREAAGEMLAFLDADDRWLPERLERQLEALRVHPNGEAIVCGTRVVDRELRVLGVHAQDPSVTPEDLLLCRARIVSVSSNLLITRGAFEAIGGFDERLSTSADWAFMFHLLERGRLVTLDDPLVDYRLHDSNMSGSVARFEHDMFEAFRGVFSEPHAPADRLRLRRRAYANLRRTIAGSYFVRHQFGQFAVHAARSIGEHPSTLGYFLRLPLRRLGRARAGATDPFTSLHAPRRPRA